MPGNKNIFESVGITPLQLVIVGAGGMLIYSIANKFGLIKGDESKKADALSTNKIYEPGYTQGLINKGVKVYLIKKESLQTLAYDIYKAKGFFKDDNGRLWGALKTIHYKTQISQLNKFFIENYKSELFTYLKTFLNNDELAEVYNYFNSLPSGLV